jgi:hypothetical protein
MVLHAGGRALAGHAQRAQVRALVDAVVRMDAARAADTRLLVEALELEGDRLPEDARDELCRAVLAIHCERKARALAAGGAVQGCRPAGEGGW